MNSQTGKTETQFRLSSAKCGRLHKRVWRIPCEQDAHDCLASSVRSAKLGLKTSPLLHPAVQAPTNKDTDNKRTCETMPKWPRPRSTCTVKASLISHHVAKNDSNSAEHRTAQCAGAFALHTHTHAYIKSSHTQCLQALRHFRSYARGMAISFTYIHMV